jgi:hypothetical protein
VQIAVEKFSEATVGYRQNREAAERWVQLFYTHYFIVTAVSAAILLRNLPQVILKDLDPLLGAAVQQISFRKFAAPLQRGRGFEVYFE